MSNLRISESLMFAIEMSRAVLTQHTLIPGIDQTSPFGAMDINFQPITEADETEERKFYITFKLRGVDEKFVFYCLTKREEEGWVSGWVMAESIASWLGSGPKFKCRLEGTTIVASKW